MNTQTKEALKMAVKVLQNNKRTHYYCEDTWYSCPKHEDGCANDYAGENCDCGADKTNQEFDIAIQACKEALEQPAQEPVAWMSGGGVITKLKTEAQLWVIKGGSAIPLYTNPAPSWQGLSGEELENIKDEVKSGWYDFARAIEQALKEKNNAV